MIPGRSGFIGGNLSFAGRQLMLNKYILHRPSVEFGPRWMCQCGTTARIHWRRRWYCPRCGHWIHDDAIDIRVQELGADPRTASDD